MSDEQRPDETLRDFLDRRERELSEGIAVIHGQLVFKEKELAEIRRAKGALGIPVVHHLSAENLAAGSPQFTAPTATLADAPSLVFENNSLDVTAHRQAAETIGTPIPSPYQDLTMKQLVKKALKEHFADGASTNQLREFFRDAWGRDIERTSLSPQLSRLYTDQIIDRRGGRWFLKPVTPIKRHKFT